MYVSNAEESSRLFKSNFLEFFSKVHFIVPFIIFAPAICYFIYIGIGQSPLNMLFAFGLGLFVWTIIEYVMHRFVFHFHPSSPVGKRLHYIFHGVHHAFPKDRLRLVLPPLMSIPLASFFFFLFSSFTESPLFNPFFAGFLFGYLCYDMLHYAIHHVNFKGKLWNILKTNHLKHHYVDDTKGFGVSSTMWDQVAKSGFTKRKLNVNVKESSIAE